MIALKNQTVAEIVLDYPNSVRLFESYKIDYCCKGKLTLEEACYLKNLDSNHVAAMITEIISEKKNLGEDFSQLTIHTLIDIVLHRHHNYVNNSIPIIKDHLGKVLAKHGSDYPFLSEIHDKFADLAIELEQHMVKEEQILFPYLSFIEEVFLKGVADSRISVFLKHPVHMMENDHERAGGSGTDSINFK
ncbi:MAG: DUF542 domain-containing protein [Bacteroidetes bacterium]|nr:DUF542 domain-containing protein [Bacteroidota bacterium]